MKKIFLFLVALLLATNVSATELYDFLIKIPGVVSVENLDKGSFNERYVVMITQPLDHKKPQKGTFQQRFVVASVGADRPNMFITEGYGGARALSPRYREEISRHLNTNQIFVEHRFFGESTPSPRNWDYMTGENAAADLHKIFTSLKPYFSKKWLASGVSKGGQNTFIYTSFYPNDMDVAVPYVGPVCFGVEDGRHEPFLDNVGTADERKAIRDFQIEVLKRRDALMPLFNEYIKSKGLKFYVPAEEIYDYCVFEYPFSIWQWGTPVSQIPDLKAPHQEIFDHFLAIAGPDYFTITDEPSFFVQAARELGYYGYDTKPFEGLLKVQSSKGYLAKLFLPEDARNIKFSDKLSKQIYSYLKNNDPRMICIYGEIDPWSAAIVSSDLFEGKKNMQLVVENRGSHRARIGTQPAEVQDAIWKQLEEWLK